MTYTITVTLSTPPTTTFSINDITNKINFNGIDPSLYEISQNAGTTYATVTADSTFPWAQSVLIRKKATPTTTVSAAQTLSFTSSPLSISGSAFSQLQSFYNFDDNDVHTIFAWWVVDPEGGEIIYEMTGWPSPDSWYNSINSSTWELQLFYDAFWPTDFSVTITARTRSWNKSISKSFTIHFNDII